MLATTHEAAPVHNEDASAAVKSMTTKDLLASDLPDEDAEDPDYLPDQEAKMDDDMDEDVDDDDNDDEDDKEEVEEIDVQEVSDLQMEFASVVKSKVLRSGFKAASGDYRDVTIMDPLDDDEDDEDYQDDADEVDDDDEGSDDDENAADDADEHEVDEQEVKDNIVNMVTSVSNGLPTTDATVLRHGKEIPAASAADVDLIARMRELMQE
ncbi:hypothetical protein HDU78_002938 [Chytriomyces hyalinus]|nr:hypothetical protein HDU78_002938 [Chytriomyces hyalinus]KAJ3267164.1 hypothetical protein HDU77_005367 [Chytriomyces hyalinus]